MSRTVTRQELFDAVWSRPMVQVARDYGISDVAIKKICLKMAVPTPGRGYWRRKKLGYAVITSPAQAPAKCCLGGSEIPDTHTRRKDVAEASRRKLRMVNNAKMLHDLRIPPASRLEKLRGKRRGHYSICINASGVSI